MKTTNHLLTFVLPMIFALVLLYFELTWVAIIFMSLLTVFYIYSIVRSSNKGAAFVKLKESAPYRVDFAPPVSPFVPLVSERGNVYSVYFSNPDHVLDA